MTGLSLALGVLLLYALMARPLGRWSVSAPIVLVAAGIVLGQSGFGLLHLAPSAGAVRATAEVTLALLLFADASTIRLREAEGDARLPGRLLGIGLPLTIALGTLVARVVLPVSWAQAALIASILAPTDAALGLDVVTDRAVPVRIRRALTIESGLNDGIATPFVVFFLAVVAAEEAHQHWILGGLKEIGLALLFGAALGAASGALGARARRAEWTTPLSESLAVLSVALVAYEGGLAVHANGFVSAFVAGIFFGTASGRRLRQGTAFTEDIGLVLSFAVWMLFGALLAGPVLERGVHLRAVLYAVLSLTLIRMAPVALALVGLRLRRDTIGFVGWFGPRGLASVVFTLLIFEGLAGAHGSSGLVEVATWTVLLSVVAHGLTARPLAARYGRRIGAAEPDAPERAQTVESTSRRRSLHDHRAP